MLTLRLKSRNIIIIKPLVLPSISRQTGDGKRVSVFEPGDAWEPIPAFCEQLDISFEFQDRDSEPKPPRSGWGKIPSKTKFGRNGFERVLDLCCELERRGGDLLFLTLTIPGSGIKVAKEVSRYSGYIVNLFKQKYRDLADRIGCKQDTVHVWEWQKRGMLHLHFVVGSNSSFFLYQVARGLKKDWTSVLDRVSEKSGRDLWRKTKNFSHSRDKSVLQVNCQRIKSTVAGYLAKYLGKAKSKESRKAWFCPSRWWGGSRALLRSALAAGAVALIPVFRNSTELAVTSVITGLNDCVLKSTWVPYRYRDGGFWSVRIRRENYQQVKKEIESMSNTFPSSNLLMHRSSDPISAFWQGYLEELKDSWQVSTVKAIYREHCDIELLPCFERDLMHSGVREFAALLLIYSGRVELEIGWSHALHLAKEGSLYDFMLNEMKRELPEGMEF